MIGNTRFGVDHGQIFALGQTYRKLTPDDTLTSYLEKLGIDEDVHWAIRDELGDIFTRIQTQNE